MIRAATLALALLAAAAPARDLPVPADKGWQHAATGLVLRRTLAGLPRTALTDSTTGEWDVAAQFNDPALADSLTVYLFHAATPDVGLWFDRADWQVRHRESFGGSEPLADPVAFAPPGSGVAAALRRLYRPNNGPYRSTVLAVLPLGPWLVALRMSSTTLDPAALDARLSAAIAELGWPKDAPAAAPAAPVAACPTPLAYHKAKLNKPDLSQTLLGSMLGGMVVAGHATPETPSKPWCRDGEGTAEWGVYRREGTSDSYLLAFGDAGRTADIYAATVIPGLSGPGGFSVMGNNVDGSIATYPSFDALPRPDQVAKLLTTGAPTARTSATGKQVTISVNSSAVK